MISFLRKAKIIFTPALETIISIHEDTYVESRIGVGEKYTATFEDVMVNSMYIS